MHYLEDGFHVSGCGQTVGFKYDKVPGEQIIMKHVKICNSTSCISLRTIRSSLEAGNRTF